MKKSIRTTVYGKGLALETLKNLDKLEDAGVMKVELPEHMFFKNGKPKKKYFKRTTYSGL